MDVYVVWEIVLSLKKQGQDVRPLGSNTADILSQPFLSFYMYLFFHQISLISSEKISLKYLLLCFICLTVFILVPFSLCLFQKSERTSFQFLSFLPRTLFSHCQFQLYVSQSRNQSLFKVNEVWSQDAHSIFQLSFTTSASFFHLYSHIPLFFSLRSLRLDLFW